MDNLTPRGCRPWDVSAALPVRTASARPRGAAPCHGERALGTALRHPRRAGGGRGRRGMAGRRAPGEKRWQLVRW